MITQCAPALTPWDQSRLRGRLARDGVLKTRPRLRKRAQVLRFRGDPGDLAALGAEPYVLRTGVSAAPTYGLDLHAPGVLEAYMPATSATRIVDEYLLEPNDRPNVVAHVIPTMWPFPEHAQVAPEMIVGLDLYEADDERARRAGRAVLERLGHR